MFFIVLIAVAVAAVEDSCTALEQEACEANSGCTYTAAVEEAGATCANTGFQASTDPCIAHTVEEDCTADTTNSCAFTAASVATCVDGDFEATTDPCLAVTDTALDSSTACDDVGSCTFTSAVTGNDASCVNGNFEASPDPCLAFEQSACDADTVNNCTFDSSCANAEFTASTDPCLDITQTDQAACGDGPSCTFTSAVAASVATCVDGDFEATTDPCLAVTDTALDSSTACDDVGSCTFTSAAGATCANPSFEASTDPCIDHTVEGDCTADTTNSCAFTAAVTAVEEGCATSPSSSAAITELLFGALVAAVALIF